MRNFGKRKKRNIAQNEGRLDTVLIWLPGAVLQRD